MILDPCEVRNILNAYSNKEITAERALELIEDLIDGFEDEEL